MNGLELYWTGIAFKNVPITRPAEGAGERDPDAQHQRIAESLPPPPGAFRFKVSDFVINFL